MKQEICWLQNCWFQVAKVLNSYEMIEIKERLAGLGSRSFQEESMVAEVQMKTETPPVSKHSVQGGAAGYAVNVRKALCRDGAETQIFLAAYALWLTATELKLTMWAYITPASRLFSCMQLAAYLLLAVQFCAKLLPEHADEKGSYRKKLSGADVIGLLLILFSWALALHAGRTNRQIVPVMLFLYFSANVPYKKILKYTVTIQLSAMVFAILTACCGLIEDTLWTEGARIRHGLGYDYCGYPAHIMLFVTMSWLCIREKAHVVDAAALLALNLVIYYFTDSRTDLLLAVIGIAGSFVWGRSLDMSGGRTHCPSQCASRGKVLRGLEKAFCGLRRFLAKFAFLIAFAVSVLVHYFYNPDNTLWYRINETLNGRLKYGYAAIQEYGFSLFGRAIRWYGQGSLRMDSSAVYNYVDNSFLKELLTYGWVFAVILVIGFYLAGKELVRQKEWMLCWALLITIAYSMLNAQLCVLSFQAFILIPGRLFATRTPNEARNGRPMVSCYSDTEAPGLDAPDPSGQDRVKKIQNSRMRFLNTEIDNLTFEEALDWIEARLGARPDSMRTSGDGDSEVPHSPQSAAEAPEKKRNAEKGLQTGAYIVTPNVDHIVRLETDEKLQKAYAGASLVLTDGQPLIWISKWLGTPIKEKISGSDLFPRVCQLAAKKGYRMYFLGAAPGVAETAAQKLEASCPGLQVVGTYSPAYGFEKDEDQVREVWRKIHEAKPDILIAALGTPKQEIFLWEHRDELAGMLGIGIGAGLDFAAGNVKRAPRWMQKCGLEWFYRLCSEPKRLFKRYLIDDLKILPIVWKYRK